MDALPQGQRHAKRFVTVEEWGEQPRVKNRKPCRKCRHPREHVQHDWRNRRWCGQCGEYV